MNNFKFKKEKKIKMVGYYVSAGNEKHSCLAEEEFVESVSEAMKRFKKSVFELDGVKSSVYQKATFFEISPVYEGFGEDFDQSVKVLKSELEFN